MNLQSGREVELKLELRAEDLLRISSLKSLPQARISAPKAEQIYSVYFDTPDYGLRRAGLTLRMRHAGAKRLQTVKCESRAGAALDRGEDEVALVGTQPDIAQVGDPQMRARLADAAAQDALRPVFETAVLRTTRMIRAQNGGEIELAIDTGDVRANGHARAICEVELELKSGAPGALYRVARALTAKAPMRVSQISKSDRGYALCGLPAAAPQKARAPKLKKQARAADAFRAALASCLAQILANETVVLEGSDVEGLHQLRVALRRLRSALKVFEPLIAKDARGGLEETVKDLAQVCGAARDLDVFVAELLPRGRAVLKPHKGVYAALQAAAAAARQEAWGDVHAALKAAGFTTLVLDLAGRACEDETGRNKAAARDFARAVLDKELKKVTKLARHLDALDDEERHALRKRLKRLRYSGEFFASLFAEKAAKAYSRRLNALQDSFGALNDLATAQRLVARFVESGALAPAQAEAAQALVAWYRETAQGARQEAGERWAQFEKHRPFWHET